MLTGHSQAFLFSVCPQLMLSWEMNTQRLIQSGDWEESNFKAKVWMFQLGSEFIRGQSISQYPPYNISSFKRPLWHFQFSAKHAISPDSCYSARHTISEWHFSKMVCKPWLEYMKTWFAFREDHIARVMWQTSFSITDSLINQIIIVLNILSFTLFSSTMLSISYVQSNLFAGSGARGQYKLTITQ